MRSARNTFAICNLFSFVLQSLTNARQRLRLVFGCHAPPSASALLSGQPRIMFSHAELGRHQHQPRVIKNYPRELLRRIG